MDFAVVVCDIPFCFILLQGSRKVCSLLDLVVGVVAGVVEFANTLGFVTVFQSFSPSHVADLHGCLVVLFQTEWFHPTFPFPFFSSGQLQDLQLAEP